MSLENGVTVKRARSPGEDKALTYAHERRGFAEYPHAFRGKWRKKKAALEGACRARVRDELLRAVGTPAEADLDALAVEAIVRKRATKWDAASLGEWVASRFAKRTRFTGRNFFKAPYDASAHRARFTVFLTDLVKGRGEGARDMARRFGALLSPPTWPVPPDTQDHEADRDRVWLATFLADEPGWAAKLAAWTREVGADAQGSSGGIREEGV